MSDVSVPQPRSRPLAAVKRFYDRLDSPSLGNTCRVACRHPEQPSSVSHSSTPPRESWEVCNFEQTDFLWFLRFLPVEVYFNLRKVVPWVWFLPRYLPLGNGNPSPRVIVEEKLSCPAVLLAYKTGRRGCRSRSPPYQAAGSQPADHRAFSVLRDGKEYSVVGG